MYKNIIRYRDDANTANNNPLNSLLAKGFSSNSSVTSYFLKRGATTFSVVFVKTIAIIIVATIIINIPLMEAIR